MRIRPMHKMVTNPNGHVSNIAGGLIALIGFAFILGLFVSLFD
jgi:hypothetical protein